MAVTDDRTNAPQQAPTPNPDLKGLERLVGTRKVAGEARGQIRYEWTDGGFFLVQHVDLEYGGRKIKGMEVIGHRQRLGEEPSKDIRTRFYSFLDGLTLDYVYELVDDTLTIWFGQKGSTNRFQGTFRPDGKSFSGAWEWPGGGYGVTGTRLG